MDGCQSPMVEGPNQYGKGLEEAESAHSWKQLSNEWSWRVEIGMYLGHSTHVIVIEGFLGFSVWDYARLIRDNNVW